MVRFESRGITLPKSASGRSAEVGAMLQSNSTSSTAASTPQRKPAVMGLELPAPRTAVSEPAPKPGIELAYGCVDWFIYVENAAPATAI
jgi:hypothetical protein